MTDRVDSVYQKALELGAVDEGTQESSSDGLLYAGYFRDLDGNKLNAFCPLADL